MTQTTRMRAEDRRELILEAATRVFGDRGYIGATTNLVAVAAGVSQPYVVRIFGTKEKL
ncbi:MAG: TetR/AcrR family transcriptional regulator, partial [Microbacteriaceae bacterium]|nr:TetR/AcrR family transcriptional regulator [Microbacteriaceae bacterium]